MPFCKVVLSATLALVFIAISIPAKGTPYAAVVAYGDSLSDNGNLYALSGYPPPPYYMGRLSNGPVAVEQLGSTFGVPLYDLAFIGATSGIGNYADGGTQTTLGLLGLPGIQLELASPASTSILSSPLTSSGLFVVWGGANDFVIGGSPAVAAANIDGIVAALEGHGVQHILVPGMPDLGLTPDYYGNALATAYSQQFNTLLLASLPTGATYVDTFDLMHQIESNPGAFGFTNVTSSCFNGVTVCANPNQYLFWDGFHPTTAADAILASEFTTAATPEPSSLLLLGTGICGLAVWARRRWRNVTY